MTSPPVKGSTAPVITSALVAWPARPVERTSPLSPPSASLFRESSTSIPSVYSKPLVPNNLGTMTRSTSSSQGKGKERAVTPEVVVQDEERKYPPPKRPLTPNQLGRIAQSFGIVIPSLPVPSPSVSPLSATAGSSRHPNIAPTRPSPYLLTVIPPITLLSAPEDGDRSRRWKRGRLLPLQPTMGSMLLCIAREYGLPSTVGLGLYLVTPSHPSSSSSISSSMSDEASGPLISASTWSTLFSTYIAATSAQSRSSTPSHTPAKPSGALGRDITFPPSPLSLVEKHSQRDRQHSFTSTSEALQIRPIPKLHSSHSSSSSGLPLTPGSSTTTHATLNNTIVGTIEFDIDPDQAHWLVDWKRSGSRHRHRRQTSSVSDSGVMGGGVRQLRLVRKVNDDRSRTLEFIHQEKDRERDTISSSGSGVFAATGDTTLVTDDETEEYKVSYMPNSSKKLNIIPADTSMAISITASLDHYTEENDHVQAREAEEETVLDPKLLTPNPMEDELLASPIKLDKGQLERVKMEMDKRGSGMIMADELDDLEKIMRQLSPREIRLTSPRAMTPRMTAKVAAARVQAANLSLPGTNGRVPHKSPLASSQSIIPSLPARPVPASRAVSDPPKQAAGLARPAWPAVPFGSPHSPNLDDIFRPPVTTISPVSAETLQRMQTSPPRQVSSEWRPPRPPRPASPKLEHQRTLSHTLSPELIVNLRSPPSNPLGSIQDSPGAEDGKKRRSRSGTVSIRGLRHQMSAKNLNLKWGGEKEKEKHETPDMPLNKETVGLFRGATEGATSSFASLKDSLPQQHPSVVNEFGMTGNATPADVPAGTQAKHGFASRLLSFGRKPSISSSTKRDSQRSVSAPKSSRRNLSQDGPIISGPIASTFHKIDGSITEQASHVERRTSDTSIVRRPSNAQPTSPRSPASPASPRSVKRKPVPGLNEMGRISPPTDGVTMDIPESESMNSMRSFVLDDPPKRRVMPLGAAV